MGLCQRLQQQVHLRQQIPLQGQMLQRLLRLLQPQRQLLLEGAVGAAAGAVGGGDLVLRQLGVQLVRKWPGRGLRERDEHLECLRWMLQRTTNF